MPPEGKKNLEVTEDFLLEFSRRQRLYGAINKELIEKAGMKNMNYCKVYFRQEN
jgi:hypothetical protein